MEYFVIQTWLDVCGCAVDRNAADQEADLLWYVRQTHGIKRAALTAASDITSPLENCAVPSDYRAAADRRFRLSTAALV